MEEKESMESEPGVQTESLSLIISDEGEEEASPPYSASAQLAAGKHTIRVFTVRVPRQIEEQCVFAALIRLMNNSAQQHGPSPSWAPL